MFGRRSVLILKPRDALKNKHKRKRQGEQRRDVSAVNNMAAIIPGIGSTKGSGIGGLPQTAAQVLQTPIERGIASMTISKKPLAEVGTGSLGMGLLNMPQKGKKKGKIVLKE